MSRRDYNGIPVDEKCSCGAPIPLKVCMSGAGYYLGSWCDNCGPYSRESGYFPTRELAEKALDTANNSDKKCPLGYCDSDSCTCMLEMEAEYNYLDALHKKAQELNIPITEMDSIKGEN